MGCTQSPAVSWLLPVPGFWELLCPGAHLAGVGAPAGLCVGWPTGEQGRAVGVSPRTPTPGHGVWVPTLRGVGPVRCCVGHPLLPVTAA